MSNIEQAEVSTQRSQSSQALLLFIGVLWLLLGGYILYAQFSRPAVIQIDWQTETEFDTAGFNIFRSDSPEGEFVQINEQLIPSQADPASGASYTYVDTNVEAGQTYFYKLEDVEYSNVRQQHDTIAGQAPTVEVWALILAAVSLVLGLALIAMGIKGAKS
ncbi:MAG: hypothetical protein KDD89_03680 [Anaerolineales bacterium]|nr:hypothetical protein [Anaerolineales bacterium]